MYYLKTVCGNKKRFNAIKDIFIFLEFELSKRRYNQKQSYIYNVLSLLGENFNSTGRTYCQGYEDSRNKGIGLFRSTCSFRGWNLTSSHYARNNLVDGEKCVWLATNNKYIVVDWQGGTVPLAELRERYKHRFESVHQVTPLYRGYTPYPNGVKHGYKGDKVGTGNWSRVYKERAFCRSEMEAVTSRDEGDVSVPLRQKRINKLKWLAEYNDFGNYRDEFRSWKHQSKKRKQWN